MRARAIENGSFVFAAAQGGEHENGRETFGHSLVVDPWGRIIAEGGTEPGVMFADIDPAEVVGGARRASPRCSTAGASRSSSRWRSRRICMWSEATRDPLRARLRQAATTSRAGSRIPPPTTSRPSAGWSHARCAARPRSRRPSWRRASPRKDKSTPIAAPAEESRAGAAPRGTDAGRDDLAAGAGIPRQAEGAARSPDGKNADNVGKKFPEEARKMHYGEIEHRSIYGEASPQDAKELHEEGIEFHPLPVLPDERN